jgi:phytoene dehydrogenase-like protein
MYAIVRALAARLDAAGGELRLGTPAGAVRAGGVEAPGGWLACDLVVDSREPPYRGEPSLSGLALMLGLAGRTPGLAHHNVWFCADYDAEFDDVFVHRRPVRDPTLYVSCPEVTEGGGDESWFVLANAPAAPEHDWAAEAERLRERLALGDRVRSVAVRSPADLERETGAAGGSIYGPAPHGRLAPLRRQGNRPRGVDGVWRVGGSVHPGGGLPLVMLGAATVARAIGPAR